VLEKERYNSVYTVHLPPTWIMLEMDCLQEDNRFTNVWRGIGVAYSVGAQKVSLFARTDSFFCTASKSKLVYSTTSLLPCQSAQWWFCSPIPLPPFIDCDCISVENTDQSWTCFCFVLFGSNFHSFLVATVGHWWNAAAIPTYQNPPTCNFILRSPSRSIQAQGPRRLFDARKTGEFLEK